MKGVEILMYFFKVSTHSATLNKISLACGITVGFLFGGWTELLTAVLILHVLDMITGIMVAGKFNEIGSDKMNKGIKKKAGNWIALILAHVIDVVLFDGQQIAITGMSFVLIANEGLSIVENLGNLGVYIPDFILRYLKQIRDGGDTSEFKLGEEPDKTIERVIIEDEDGKISEYKNEREEE